MCYHRFYYVATLVCDGCKRLRFDATNKQRIQILIFIHNCNFCIHIHIYFIRIRIKLSKLTHKYVQSGKNKH